MGCGDRQLIPFRRASAGDCGDDELVRRARKGDAEAFGELVGRYQRPLMAKALRYTRQIEDADDLVQETFLRAWDKLGSFRDETRFGGWLFRILGNLAADRGRKAGREVGGGDEMAAARPSEIHGPEESMLQREIVDRVHEALRAIPEGRKKEVFLLRFVEGLPIHEIAARLGVHSGTVKVHLFRLTRDLRRRYRELEDTP